MNAITQPAEGTAPGDGHSYWMPLPRLSLSHTLKQARGGRTSDDATLLMVEWRG